jgi:hypothetical protein
MPEITVFICTSREVAKEITQKYLGIGMPYVNILEGKTYGEVVAKVEELEKEK